MDAGKVRLSSNSSCHRQGFLTLTHVCILQDHGTKSTKYYVKFVSRPAPTTVEGASPGHGSGSPLLRTPSPAATASITPPAPLLPQWRIKTQQEYVSSLSPSEIKKKGGLGKLEKQSGNRYFKRKRLVDILMLHAMSISVEDKELLPSFIHFLYGLLDHDPWKRLTSFQASQHPFVTGDFSQLRKRPPEITFDSKEENQANLELETYWQPPWDPSICRRKLLNVQKIREKQQTLRRSGTNRPHSLGGFNGDRRNRRSEPVSPMDESPLPQRLSGRGGVSPPNQVSGSSSATPGQTYHPPLFHGATSEHDLVSGGNPSSLSSLANPTVRSQLAFGGNVSPAHVPMPAPAMPKSFTGVSLHDIRGRAIEVDLANALQRPGVVPSAGTGGDGSFMAQSWGSNHLLNVQAPFNIESAHYGSGSGYLENGIIPGTPATQPLTQGSLQSFPGGHGMNPLWNSYGMYNSQAAPSHQSSQYMAPAPSHQHCNPGGFPSSSTSSITMADAPGYHHDMPFIDQNQFVSFQMNPSVPLQQQHTTGVQHHASLPFQNGPIGQQHQLQLSQPVFLAGGPESGYFYVTTSANGQPIVLQPVAVFNQHSNQFEQQGPSHQIYSQYMATQTIPTQFHGPNGFERGQPMAFQTLQPQQQRQMRAPHKSDRSNRYMSGSSM